MSLPTFNEIQFISNLQISEMIVKTESKLFDLKFKSATRQYFKPHKIKHLKRKIAHLKTLLTSRLDLKQESQPDSLTNLIKKQNYLTENFKY